LNVEVKLGGVIKRFSKDYGNIIPWCNCIESGGMVKSKTLRHAVCLYNAGKIQHSKRRIKNTKDDKLKMHDSIIKSCCSKNKVRPDAMGI